MAGLAPLVVIVSCCWALACRQVRHRRWRSLLLSDLLGAGVLVLLAISLYLPLFFNVAWFLPVALLPRGVLIGNRKQGSRSTPWPSKCEAPSLKQATATFMLSSRFCG